MSDSATLQRQAKALEGIHQSVKELVKIMTVVNENLVTTGRTFQKWLEAVDKEDEEKE